jgi:hypothetical protein
MTARALTTAIAASAEPPFDASLLRAELETAVTLWQSHSIERYQVTVRHGQSTWNTQIFTIIVENGTVIDSKHTCFPEKDCILQEVDPDSLTVEALFKTAEAVIALNDPETQLTFNQTYGYPNSLTYEEASWVLDSFALLDDE